MEETPRTGSPNLLLHIELMASIHFQKPTIEDCYIPIMNFVAPPLIVDKVPTVSLWAG